MVAEHFSTLTRIRSLLDRFESRAAGGSWFLRPISILIQFEINWAARKQNSGRRVAVQHWPAFGVANLYCRVRTLLQRSSSQLLLLPVFGRTSPF